MSTMRFAVKSWSLFGAEKPQEAFKTAFEAVERSDHALRLGEASKAILGTLDGEEFTPVCQFGEDFVMMAV